jgi:hypothetical protein
MTGELSLGMTLFDGAKGKLDLIPAVSASIDALKEVVDAAGLKERVDFNLTLDATLTGSVSGTMKAVKNEGDTTLKPSGEIEAELGLTIKGELNGSVSVFRVKYEAGAHVYAASDKDKEKGMGIKGTLSFAAPKDEKSALDYTGDVLCTGARIYYGMYAKLEHQNASEAGQDGSGGGNVDSDNDSQTTAQATPTFKLDRQCSFVVLEEFSLKKMLKDNVSPPSLVQYEQADFNGLYSDGSSADNCSTIPSVSLPDFH